MTHPPKGKTVLLTRHKNCPGCVAMRRKLNRAKIDFMEVYIDDDAVPTWVRPVMRLGVPQLYHDGTRIHDGDVDAWIRNHKL